MKAISDIAKKNWIFDEEEDLPEFSIDLKIGFRDNEKLPVSFSELSFGYSVKLNDKVISEMSFPSPGSSYVSTDQEYLERFTIWDMVTPGKNYLLNVWSSNDGEFWSDSFLITIPPLPQPYPSWTLDEETGRWFPPVEYPDDGNSYEWNEESQEWNLREI